MEANLQFKPPMVNKNSSTLIAVLIFILTALGCSKPRNIPTPELELHLKNDFMNPGLDITANILGTSEVPPVQLDDYEDFSDWCENVDVSNPVLTDEEAKVPYHFVKRSPVDQIKKAQDISTLTKKNLIACLFLPHIVFINNSIIADRQRLRSLSKKIKTTGSLSPKEEQWVKFQALEYSLINSPYRDMKTTTRNERRANHLKHVQSIFNISLRDLMDSLFHRMNAMPPALVLGQIIEESQWGVSRFTEVANNPLGLQTSIDPQKKIPKYCEPALEDPSTCVYKFPNLQDAIWEYYRRYNTSGKDFEPNHPEGTVYGPYRSMRALAEDNDSLCLTSLDILNQEGTGPYAEKPGYDQRLIDIIYTHSSIIKFDGLLKNSFVCENMSYQ